jgi:O-antigen/teichoic acid export membrane protein
MQQPRYGMAKGLLILAYLCLGPIVCATVAFDKPVIILAVGSADAEARIAMLVCAILFVALCVYVIYSSWYDYQSLRDVPIYGVGMIYAPSLVVGIAVFACVRYVSRRLKISGNR